MYHTMKYRSYQTRDTIHQLPPDHMSFKLIKDPLNAKNNYNIISYHLNLLTPYIAEDNSSPPVHSFATFFFTCYDVRYRAAETYVGAKRGRTGFVVLMQTWRFTYTLRVGPFFVCQHL